MNFPIPRLILWRQSLLASNTLLSLTLRIVLLSFHMASYEMMNVLEHCRISPPPSSVDEKSLPLSFFDLQWLHFHPMQDLFFYEYPHSTAHYIETTIPSLKRSLSLTLKHFYPYAGNLALPPNLGMPEIRYADGDSMSVTFAESKNDFNYFIQNHQRNVSQFHPLLPQLPPDSVSQGTIVAPLSAIQVTLFPNSGISIGFTINHVVADGSSFYKFIKSWASIHKSGDETSVILPLCDRSVLKDRNRLDSIFWQQVGKTKFGGCQPQPPTDNILGSFLLSEADLQRLKKWVMAQLPTLPHVSSFTVACAYTWACMVKARSRSGEEVAENELEHLGFEADCRAHLDPPVPGNYFGNCVAPCTVTARSLQLIDKDGFLVAVQVIGEAIRERLHNKEGVLKGAEKWLLSFESLHPDRMMGVSWSPKLVVHDIDFGLGHLQKREIVSIDVTRAISLHEGKNNKRDIEVGLSFPKIEMDAFTCIFADDLIKVYD